MPLKFAGVGFSRGTLGDQSRARRSPWPLGLLGRPRGDTWGGPAPRGGGGYNKPTTLECTTPPQTLVGLLALEVSRNADAFTGDEVLFEYQATLRLAELAPSRGPRSGGPVV